MIKKNMWNTGAKAGLILGLVSTVYMFITQLLGTVQMGTFLSSVLSLVLWAAKFGGCIWIMSFFMKKFAAENPEADNSMTFKFGMVASILSALIFAAANFANMAYISADFFQTQMEAVMQAMAPQLDSNMMQSMEKTLENLPQMMFFYYLIYCFIFGTILSAILSRNIPSRNPFADSRAE